MLISAIRFVQHTLRLLTEADELKIPMVWLQPGSYDDIVYAIEDGGPCGTITALRRAGSTIAKDFTATKDYAKSTFNVEG